MSRIANWTDIDTLLLPGVPADYIGTPIVLEELCLLLSQPEVVHALLSDKGPLPTTEAREGYFGPRHLEYWLSGRRDAQKFMAGTPALSNEHSCRVLDFGGATGRVARHVAQILPNAEIYLSDINPVHVTTAQRMFGTTLRVFRNQGVPALPFPDDFLDAVCAFSVFTHIDADDTAWLLELRRVVRPGGTIYVTVHDDQTWERAPRLPAIFGGPEMVDFRGRHPQLIGKIVHHYSEQTDYGCNTFVSTDYIGMTWAPLFATWRITPMAHDHQAAVMLDVA